MTRALFAKGVICLASGERSIRFRLPLVVTDEEIGEHLSNPRIIRHGKKIAAIRDNAQFLGELARENGSAAAVLAHWPSSDFVGLLTMLKKRATRLGGNSANVMPALTGAGRRVM